MIDNNFYDTWVSIDLDGNRVRGSFPFFLIRKDKILLFIMNLLEFLVVGMELLLSKPPH